MGVLELFRDLVIEHGSAQVSKERIELLKEQFTVLEKKLQEAETARNKAEHDSQKFELECFKLKAKVQELESRINDKQMSKLDKDKEEILLEISSSEKLSDYNGFRRIKGNTEVIRFHLGELKDLKYVHPEYFTTGEIQWGLTQEGRRYLISNGLIS